MFPASSFYAISILIGSYLGEFFFHKTPCQLCVYGRYLMVFLFITSFLRWKKLHFFMLFFALSFNLYQAAVQYRLIKTPLCHGKFLRDVSLNSKQNTLDFLKNQKIQPPCDQVSWSLGGISVTLWNSVGLFLLIIYTLRQRKRH